MNKEQSNSELLIKTSANFIALWISSLILGIPILFLIKYPNPIFFGILIIGAMILFYYLYQETSNELPALHMMEDKLEIKSNIIEYDEIEYFQFTGYKVDKKMTIDRNWWAPRILQLHIKTKNGQTLWNSIPNKMGNYEIIKQEIRTIFHDKKVEEKKEKLR